MGQEFPKYHSGVSTLERPFFWFDCVENLLERISKSRASPIQINPTVNLLEQGFKVALN